MTGSALPDSVKDVRLEQYRQCCELGRHFDTMAWQVPTATMTIDGGLLALSYEILDGVPRLAVLLLAGIFTMLMLVQLAKHRLSLDSIVNFREHLANDILLVEADGRKDFPSRTEEMIGFLRSRPGWSAGDPLYRKLIHRRAYFWTQYGMLAIALGLWILMVLEGAMMYLSGP